MLIQNSYHLLIIFLAADGGWPPAANFTLVSQIWYLLKPHQMQPWIPMVPLEEIVFLFLLLFPNQTRNKINDLFYLLTM